MSLQTLSSFCMLPHATRMRRVSNNANKQTTAYRNTAKVTTMMQHCSVFSTNSLRKCIHRISRWATVHRWWKVSEKCGMQTIALP
jgi:hypothetical protein